jgi:hypothetical protein
MAGPRGTTTEVDMKWNRREAIERMIQLAGLAVLGTPLSRVEPVAASDTPGASAAEQASARTEYFRLIRIWGKMPEGPEKERVFLESYRLYGVFEPDSALRVPEFDRALGMELPLEQYCLPKAEENRLRAEGWR